MVIDLLYILLYYNGFVYLRRYRNMLNIGFHHNRLAPLNCDTLLMIANIIIILVIFIINISAIGIVWLGIGIGA